MLHPCTRRASSAGWGETFNLLYKTINACLSDITFVLCTYYDYLVNHHNCFIIYKIQKIKALFNEYAHTRVQPRPSSNLHLQRYDQ